jgi:glutamine---fructose-6-phosphate transaminase (isomerizing)
MNQMKFEISEIPERALEFLKLSPSYSLPLGIPYLGMGSSYFAPLAFKFMGVPILPEIASEYFNSFSDSKKSGKAVIISQSGQSSEALWCARLFRSYIAITNDTGSELSKNVNVSESVSILAGSEKYSSSKTYINTLLALFIGFGFDTEKAVSILVKKITDYEHLGEKMANDIFDQISRKKIHGIYVIGSGPNIATAYEASLILSESTRLCFSGMPMAQYDHGPKETSANSIVIQILAKGKSYDRSQNLARTIVNSGAHVLTVEEPDADENLSVLHNIVPFNYLAYYLSQKLNISETFVVGGKVTTT